ncbi:MAG: hypothetical protein COV76_00840 [Candidatus Omnitrophica bacterium CG11_big_fil_rev_8_21_14_0_20_64_10]|nr:MAG: hypothetical protein COV76_00840 [Candidatus Omnitrophica bacterium CG11_big_fil_rev_8_21_14_0_20_64_10]
MPKLTIDGKTVEVGAGKTVIQAAEQAGCFVPRYCYHPGLSIAGNCRICLVAVEGQKKLQIACNTQVSDGMVVHTQGEPVEQGRAEVLEFLLANHPLDCPVCDQSGECDLQNFYMAYGRYDPRFAEQKVRKPKAVPLGPTVMLDAERCILCSRCVRFTDEVSRTQEFGIFNRGDRAEVGIYPGKTLSNPYAGNVVDICPVGALTDRDFRFKARVWYLSSSPSVCPGCSKGCNIDIHYTLDRPHLDDGARVMRLKPRVNPEVNQWWMCDEGRYAYKAIDRCRILKPRHRGRALGWETAVLELAGQLARIEPKQREESVAVIAGTNLTTEALYLAARLFGEGLQIRNCSAELPVLPGSHDELLIQADKNPNRKGAELLGLAGEKARPAEPWIQAALDGKIKSLWVIGEDLAARFGEETVKQLAEKLELFVYQGSHENGTAAQAHWVLPSAVYAEQAGTFVNCDGRVQALTKAFEPLGESRPDWLILTALLTRLELPAPGNEPAKIFEALAAAHAPFAGMTYERLGLQGLPARLDGAGGLGGPAAGAAAKAERK